MKSVSCVTETSAYKNYRRKKIDGLAVCRSVSSSAVKQSDEIQKFGGQASKSTRWMPWHQEAMKDVAKLR